jgi:hypothetical protein
MLGCIQPMSSPMMNRMSVSSNAAATQWGDCGEHSTHDGHRSE